MTMVKEAHLFFLVMSDKFFWSQVGQSAVTALDIVWEAGSD